MKFVFEGEWLYILAVWAMSFFSCSLAAIFIYALLLRFRNNLIYRKMKKLEPIYAYLIASMRLSKIGENEIRNTVLPRDFPYFERYLRNTINHSDESDIRAERVVARVCGFLDYLYKRIEKSRGWNKALSLRALSYLRDEDSIKIFRSVLNSTTFYPSIFAAAMGLALNGDIESLPEVIKKVYLQYTHNEDVLLQLLSAYGGKAAPYMHEFLMRGSVSAEETCVIVDFLSSVGYEAASSTLKDMLLSTKNTEVIIHLIEALKYIGNKETADVILPFLNDGNFRVRVRAVHAVGSLAGISYIGHIEKLLWDDRWWVRRNAAEVISRMGNEGINRLKEISLLQEERPAYAAKLVLTELRYHKIKDIIYE